MAREAVGPQGRLASPRGERWKRSARKSKTRRRPLVVLMLSALLIAGCGGLAEVASAGSDVYVDQLEYSVDGTHLLVVEGSEEGHHPPPRILSTRDLRPLSVLSSACPLGTAGYTRTAHLLGNQAIFYLECETLDFKVAGQVSPQIRTNGERLARILREGRGEGRAVWSFWTNGPARMACAELLSRDLIVWSTDDLHLLGRFEVDWPREFWPKGVPCFGRHDDPMVVFHSRGPGNPPGLRPLITSIQSRGGARKLWPLLGDREVFGGSNGFWLVVGDALPGGALIDPGRLRLVTYVRPRAG